ncbi:MAG: rhamnulokinase [Clostridia bacterium]|nr:rhamnulokinase [Clostridia bacterium]
MKKILAFDYGASSGRAIAGYFDGSSLRLEELHRFDNEPLRMAGVFYWDFPRLYAEMLGGLSKAARTGEFDSVGIDTWGVDFGLLDARGQLLSNPVHYRDGGTAGAQQEIFGLIPRERLYEITGTQFLDFNSIFRLHSLRKLRPEMLSAAERLLFMPDLFGYFLTGEKYSEYSIATTSQLMDIRAGTWSEEIFEKTGLPRGLFGEIVPSGAVVGQLTDDVRAATGANAMKVVAVCGHDTQSAITAVPTDSESFAFLSSGTWSLLGTELKKPAPTKEALAANFTNEGGWQGDIGMLKNICGLWLIQESRRQYAREGTKYSYAELEQAARSVKPFERFIDPDDALFVAPGNMPEKIREYCRRTKQSEPETVGEVIRCIYDSLAFKYRATIESLQAVTGKTFEKLYIVGGGTKDTFLNGLCASALDMPVSAGPAEATVVGNLLVQLMSAGEISSLREARALVAAMPDIRTYEPQEPGEFAAAYDRFLAATR